MIMPSVPGPDGLPDRSILRSLLSALAFENLGSRRGKRYRLRKKKRRSCLGRLHCPEDPTVDENESTEEYLYSDDPDKFILDPSFVDIFYDARDRALEESMMDEDWIPIGLEPDDSVMLESVEACIRGGDGSSTVNHYEGSREQEEGISVGSASCSTLSGSEEQDKKGKEPELPFRFLMAGKGDPVEGRRRYEATLKWRKENDIDTFLYDAWPHFELIKNHYPHFFHCKGRNGEPVFYEQPPKTDLKALRNGGVSLEALLKHYAMITEFQWQYVERNDNQKSVYIIDLAGIRMTDFVGECVDFVRRASEFTAQHYPERCGYVFVINVPGWFKLIWNVIKPMVDESTLEKIYILKGKEEIFDSLLERIPIESIPQEYGGQSPYKLGESPEEHLLRDLMKHNNEIAKGNPCCYANSEETCKFCNFTYARNY